MEITQPITLKDKSLNLVPFLLGAQHSGRHLWCHSAVQPFERTKEHCIFSPI